MLYFEDIVVGDRVQGQRSYALEREEIVEFARKWDPQPFHVDEEAAQRSFLGGLTASGVHLMAIRSWLMHRMGVPFAIVAALGIDESRLKHPARPGDRLSLELEWLEKRDSRSRPDMGIVSMRSTIRNQEGATVLTVVDAVLVGRRPEAQER